MFALQESSSRLDGCDNERLRSWCHLELLWLRINSDGAPRKIGPHSGAAFLEKARCSQVVRANPHDKKHWPVLTDLFLWKCKGRPDPGRRGGRPMPSPFYRHSQKWVRASC